MGGSDGEVLRVHGGFLSQERPPGNADDQFLEDTVARVTGVGTGGTPSAIPGDASESGKLSPEAEPGTKAREMTLC
ncbi:Hypothetical protein SMAX5B_001473 [Scophthalmus maximus]|uniref:Uncharacterized protein n=1 Tax=Scophthalmus maximus TaxID=52904 RepID=A0A2U9B0U3_SCOMX|nr:Hypothetical protein SMAX5B_001473 [Scophthalmus maximus]